jgi:hypothetical protein
MDDNKRVAILIDAENISADYADIILSEASNYGDVIVKRIFADWSNTQMQSWKEKTPLLALNPQQQVAAVKGKNASDISLIIDAMSILFEKRIDVFCIASSDSDFTRLVQELREREKIVVGFGMHQTVQAFVNSFSEFIYLDKGWGKSSTEPKNEESTESEISESNLPKDRLKALQEIVEMLIEKQGKAYYGSIVTEMKNRFSDFIYKNYGSKTMKDFINKNLQAIGKYKIETASDGTTMYLVP